MTGTALAASRSPVPIATTTQATLIDRPYWASSNSVHLGPRRRTSPPTRAAAATARRAGASPLVSRIAKPKAIEVFISSREPSTIGARTGHSSERSRNTATVQNTGWERARLPDRLAEGPPAARRTGTTASAAAATTNAT